MDNKKCFRCGDLVSPRSSTNTSVLFQCHQCGQEWCVLLSKTDKNEGQAKKENPIDADYQREMVSTSKQKPAVNNYPDSYIRAIGYVHVHLGGCQYYAVSIDTFFKMRQDAEYRINNDYVVKRHGDKLLARKLEPFPLLSELER